MTAGLAHEFAPNRGLTANPRSRSLRNECLIRGSSNQSLIRSILPMMDALPLVSVHRHRFIDEQPPGLPLLGSKPTITAAATYEALALNRSQGRRGEAYAAKDPSSFEQVLANRFARHGGPDFPMPEFKGALDWVLETLDDLKTTMSKSSVSDQDRAHWNDLRAVGPELAKRPSYLKTHEHVLETMFLLSCLHDPQNRSFFQAKLEGGRRLLKELCAREKWIITTSSLLNPAALNRLRFTKALAYAQMMRVPNRGESPIERYEHDLSHAATEARFQNARPSQHDRARWSTAYYEELARLDETDALATDFALYFHSHENDATPIQPGIARCFSAEYLAFNHHLGADRMRSVIEQEAIPRNTGYEKVTSTVLGRAVLRLGRLFAQLEAAR
jgi:hypothetical protein